MSNSIEMAAEAMADQLETALLDIQKFETKGNDSAAARARKALQGVATGCKELRAAIQDERNARK